MITNKQTKKKEARKHKKKTKKKVRDHGGNDLRNDFAAGAPQGPPSRARGILGKSSKQRIKKQRIEVWFR